MWTASRPATCKHLPHSVAVLGAPLYDNLKSAMLVALAGHYCLKSRFGAVAVAIGNEKG